VTTLAPPPQATAGRTTAPGRAPVWRRVKQRAEALPFIAPAWVLIAVIGFIPLVYAVWLSLTNQSTYALNHDYVGLRNYSFAVFQGSFLSSLLVTALFVVVGVVLQFVVAYLLATFLHMELRGFKIMRTMLLTPMMVTPVIVGLMFRFIFTPGIGIAYFTERAIGLNTPWFTSAIWAKVFVIMLDTWLTTPFMMLMILAGMSAMPDEPLEAASIDGANWWQRTRHVTLPALLPVVTVALLVRIVDAARMFDQVYSSTRGGPGTATLTVSILGYDQTFQYFQFGQGAAIAIALTVLLSPVYFFYLRLTRI
jgi:multiple sugar transport system permease protein